MSKRNREKITFTCIKCGKERTVTRESYPENEICGYCRSRMPQPVPEGGKRCNRCGEWKPYTEFSHKKANSDGFESECKECRKIRKKEWREKNKEYKTPNREKVKFICKSCGKNRTVNKESYPEDEVCFYCKRKETVKEISNPEGKKKIDKRNHKEEITKQYHQTERGCFPNAKRRALKEGDESDITTDYLEEVKSIISHCEICGEEIDEYHLDHIIPLAQGGPHIRANVRYICSSCNLSRPRDGRDILGYFQLDPSYPEEEIRQEFFNTIEREHGYYTRPFSNRIILTFQPHFYEVEKEMWKDWEVRRQIYINRIKYINRSPDLLNDREILRAFKISGKHYGFSHFSPFWIKTFIREYNISSIYDPCGGWGHRLLGAWNIDYYYNDIDRRTVAGVAKIFKKFKEYNKREKEFYNEDASKFVLNKEYEAVFTCPPYFKKEEYLTEDTSTNRYPTYYDWINIWWRNVVKNTHPSKYFAFVIDRDYMDDMGKVVEEEGYKYNDMKILGKSKSHFTKGRNEVLLIYNT